VAVDTQDKRSSAAGLLHPWLALFPQPDGSDADTAAQRAQMAWAYSGIALAAPPATAAITGGFTEAQIVAGGEQITIELTNDTWVAAGATFDAERQAIIDGLDSAQAEVLGWNNEVRDKEVVGSVVRTSDTLVTITLTAAVAYDITANETITVTVPASVLVTSAGAVIGTPTFDVTFVVDELVGEVVFALADDSTVKAKADTTTVRALR